MPQPISSRFGIELESCDQKRPESAKQDFQSERHWSARYVVRACTSRCRRISSHDASFFVDAFAMWRFSVVASFARCTSSRSWRFRDFSFPPPFPLFRSPAHAHCSVLPDIFILVTSEWFQKGGIERFGLSPLGRPLIVGMWVASFIASAGRPRVVPRSLMVQISRAALRSARGATSTN